MTIKEYLAHMVRFDPPSIHGFIEKCLPLDHLSLFSGDVLAIEPSVPCKLFLQYI